jgi:hypothetical protein
MVHTAAAFEVNVLCTKLKCEYSPSQLPITDPDEYFQIIKLWMDKHRLHAVHLTSIHYEKIIPNNLQQLNYFSGLQILTVPANELFYYYVFHS